MGIASINPATGDTIKTFTALSDAELEAKLERADRAFGQYRHTMIVQRSRWLQNAADILEQKAQTFGEIITLEMGKPIAQAVAEVNKCALVCRYYADNAAEFLADRPVATDASFSYTAYHPLGAILAVMPWNFPLWQVFRFAAPALMAGNVGLLKHASNVPQCALAVESILSEAGFPSGTFQTLLVGADRVPQLLADDRIQAATLTGSEGAGISLAQEAGKNLKKTVLELGGSDPFIVMGSANLEAAVSTAVTARMLNSGQSCIAAKRFILHNSIAEEFERRFLAKLKALTVGDPLSPESDLGPLATSSIRDELHQQVQRLLKQGAQLRLGGELPAGPGNFYPPTLISDIPSGSLADEEEFFGPVALLFRVSTIDEAIALANRVPYGLGASAWTTVAPEQQQFISELEAGAVFINSMVKSDPRLPFGGIKKSGYGRELAVEGIQEFVNIKTVVIDS
ncbi:NAD-dependent succinate-semialdehyde dehydrogenase [Phormidium yuhuli AB48]|uniref:NAD-dependent succinate-semialdehyde dehydrogenase n=1 Tax=Phormidium yuhuli AB48 TaxID=2940671 RepID=A0ABY5AQY7_9CYAN|nr:NAD-dependent succinate-semialdehyde dehydrogenase [Phormidium yuhuli]USR91635.1 NAD-dependent succinate-semialdehyde dehydrogenase [Phormidium yuhuli AB48]